MNIFNNISSTQSLLPFHEIWLNIKNVYNNLQQNLLPTNSPPKWVEKHITSYILKKKLICKIIKKNHTIVSNIPISYTTHSKKLIKSLGKSKHRYRALPCKINTYITITDIVQCTSYNTRNQYIRVSLYLSKFGITGLFIVIGKL